MFKLPNQKLRRLKLLSVGLCTKCGVAPMSNKSSCRCDTCLKKDRDSTRERVKSVFGRWSSSISKRTTQVLSGKRNRSITLTWTHLDAVKAMGESIKFYIKEGFVVDHKIPIACAMHLNGTVDSEFGYYVTSLENLQIVTKSANMAKVHIIEKEIKKRAVELRRANVTGRALYLILFNEFEHRLDYTNF